MTSQSAERITDPAEIQAMIAKVPQWYHQVEVAPGILTPGHHQSASELKHLDQLGLPQDARGMRVLDIGCRDGFFAFTMEQRGAEVVGIDYADPDITGFNTCKRILGSNATYYTENVYNLNPDDYGTFDLILYLGVIYHLRNPQHSLDRIRSVAKAGTIIFVESQLSTDPTVRAMTQPLWQFYPGDTLYGDPTNKWAPNLPGLEMVVTESEFQTITSVAHGERGYVVARAYDNEWQHYWTTLDLSAGLWGRGKRPKA